jgi:hypothetical protein
MQKPFLKVMVTTGSSLTVELTPAREASRASAAGGRVK